MSFADLSVCAIGSTHQFAPLVIFIGLNTKPNINRSVLSTRTRTVARHLTESTCPFIGNHHTKYSLNAPVHLESRHFHFWSDRSIKSVPSPLIKEPQLFFLLWALFSLLYQRQTCFANSKFESGATFSFSIQQLIASWSRNRSWSPQRVQHSKIAESTQFPLRNWRVSSLSVHSHVWADASEQILYLTNQAAREYDSHFYDKISIDDTMARRCVSVGKTWTRMIQACVQVSSRITTLTSSAN